MIFRVDDPADVEAFVRSDPDVRHSLVRSWRMRRWNVLMATCSGFPVIVENIFRTEGWLWGTDPESKWLEIMIVPLRSIIHHLNGYLRRPSPKW